MKTTHKTPSVLKAAIVLTVALAFIMPGVSVFTNTTSENQTNFTLSQNQNPISIASYDSLAMPTNMRLSDELVFPTVGDDAIPGITKDENGYTVLTYTNWEDPTISHMAIWFSDTPSDPASWTGWTISLSGMDIMNYIDTAFTGGGPDEWRGLFGTFISEDMESAGGYRIFDITSDPSEWEYYTWTGGAPECTYACVDDYSWFVDLNYPDVIGPFHMYVYREIYDVYDIIDCPICFHTGVAAESGVGYFDAQSELLTAPAKDPDMANLPDRFFLTWEYHNETTDVDQIVMKKIVPASEPDIEYTPYQQYIGDGTHPSIAATEDDVAIIYEVGADITVAFSDDDGDTWDSFVVATGTFPDIEAVAGIFYATYIVEGDLFLVTSGDGGATWSEAVQLNSITGSVEEEENSVDIHAGGIAWVSNDGADFDIVWIKLPSEAPDTPSIDGPAQIKVNVEAEFTATTEDPQDNDVLFMFDWGDGTMSEWTDAVSSGGEVTVLKAWDTQGDYEVKVKAKDPDGHESDWSPSHPITVPRNKVVIRNSWFLEILQNFPMLNKIYQNILG